MTERSKFQRTLDVVAAIASCVAASAIVISSVVVVRTIRLARPAPPETAVSRPVGAEAPVVDVHGLETGVTSTARTSASAKLVLVEFSDFQCPFCGRYSRDTFKELTRDFVERGLIDYVFRSFPLPSHPSAAKAAQALECAGDQRKYWEMHTRLFDHQQQLDLPFLFGHAKALGLDAGAFTRCLDGEMAGRVRADQEEGVRLGVRATPTFLLGVREANNTIRVTRRIEGAHPYPIFKRAIEDSLAEARKPS